MTENSNLPINNNEAFGTLLKDLSKTFNCLSHNRLIVKLHFQDLPCQDL